MSEYENTVMMRQMLAEHDYNKIRELEQENESLRKENESSLRQLNKAKANFVPYSKYILWQCHEYPYSKYKSPHQKPACGQWNIKKVKIRFGETPDPIVHTHTFSCNCPDSKWPRRMSQLMPDKAIVFDTYEEAVGAQRKVIE